MITLKNALEEIYDQEMRSLAVSKVRIALLEQEKPKKTVATRPVKVLGKTVQGSITAEESIKNEQKNQKDIVRVIDTIKNLIKG